MSGDVFRFDDLVPRGWDPEDAASIDLWGQGDLVGPLRMTWTGRPGLDGVTHVEVGQIDESSSSIAVGFPAEAHCAVIVSQTCDVVTTDPGARHPFVQVSPVTVALGSEVPSLDQLRHWEVRDRVLLRPSPGTIARFTSHEPSEVALVADLRISVPVSKSLLVGAVPTPGFTAEQDLLTFSEHLAQKTTRPALHDFITTTARKLIADAIDQDALTNTAWWSQVDEVRVRCRPTRLRPTDVEFFIVHQGHSPDPASVDRWNRVIRAVQKAGRRIDIMVSNAVHETAEGLRASTFRQSSALDLPRLRRQADLI